MLRVREEALRRHVSKYGLGELRTRGTQLVFSWPQLVYDPASGQYDHTVITSVEGRRVWGGLVEFDDQAAPLVSNAKPAEEEHFVSFARSLVEELVKLCKCGEYKSSCECCEVCGGAGFTSPTERYGLPVGCVACGGSGHKEGERAS